MNYKTVKKLQYSAFFLQIAALLITVLMTVAQKSVKALIINEPDILSIRSVPIDIFIQLILILVLYGATLYVVVKSKRNNTKDKTLVFLIVSIVLRMLIPFADTLFFQAYVSMQGINAISAYTTLTTVIGYVTSPILLVAFTLHCVSLGGYYGIEQQDDTN